MNLANPPANHRPEVWAEGREGSNLYDELSAQGMISERVSLLAHYVKAKGVFRCPGDSTLWKIEGVSVAHPRSFGLNAYVGWDSGTWHNMPDEKRYQIFRKTTSCRSSASIYMFGEIHPESLCRPMFGINMDSPTIYHVPGNYHGQTSTFSVP